MLKFTNTLMPIKFYNRLTSIKFVFYELKKY